jgi:eukaryotic-like serine/threonine-protein kinase
MESVGGYRINRRQLPSPTTEIYEATGLGGQGRLVIRFLDHVQPMSAATKQACRAELMQVAKLRHPHIGQVQSLDAAPDGVPFVVREHIEGQSLKTVLGDGRWLRPGPVVHLIGALARTLSATHRVRVFHRDLRPSQVFVYDAGGVLRLGRLLGFGLWRLRTDPRAAGTPGDRLAYLAPEQLDGQAAIDGRADQFSLAAIAYRMLSGVDAFGGADPEAVVTALQQQEPAPLTAVDGVNPALDAVIRRALSRRPTARFPSVLAFAAALDSALAGRPFVPARP